MEQSTDTADRAGGCPFSLKATENSSPFDTYARMRKRSPIYWDEEFRAWVVTSQQLCREVFLKDITSFAHPDGDAGSDHNFISRGRRTTKTLSGDEQRRVHQWMLKSFSPTKFDTHSAGLVAEIVGRAIDRISPARTAELHHDLAAHIPIKVVAALMDLPWKDEALMSRAKSLLDVQLAFYNQRRLTTAELTQRAREATDGLYELFMPLILQARSGDGSRFLVRLWQEGPSLLPDWNADDVFEQLNTAIRGGYDTTTLAICNAIHALLTQPARFAEMRDAGDERRMRFVDEVLRMFPPIHYRTRRARADVVLGGVSIAAGDFVIPVLAAANRDDSKYPQPECFELDRAGPFDYLTFVTGPRSCPGRNLARLEVLEAVRQVTARLPDMRLDPSKPEPDYMGLVFRRFTPIHVTFSPEKPARLSETTQ